MGDLWAQKAATFVGALISDALARTIHLWSYFQTQDTRECKGKLCHEETSVRRPLKDVLLWGMGAVFDLLGRLLYLLL